MQIKAAMQYHATPTRGLKTNWQHQMLNRNSHTLLVGMQNSTTTLEERYGSFFKHTITIWPSDSILMYLPERPENLWSHKNLPVFIEALFMITPNWK